MEEKKESNKTNSSECGCLIDDLIEKDNDRLCGVRTNDIEVFIDPDPEKTSYNFYIRRMTDGLPIIPPTRERMLKFFNYTDRNPDDLIAVYHHDRGRQQSKK